MFNEYVMKVRGLEFEVRVSTFRIRIRSKVGQRGYKGLVGTATFRILKENSKAGLLQTILKCSKALESINVTWLIADDSALKKDLAL